MSDFWFALPILTLIGAAMALIPLGQRVLQRGVVFVDLAVAQAAAASTMWFSVFYHTHDPWLLIPASLVGALLCAACVSWMSSTWPERREALIGLLYVASAMAALLAAQYNPHGKDELQQLLAADVLWSDSADVIMALGCAAAVLSLHALRPALLNRNSVFYGLFAVVASLLVQSLGVFLVFALLIGPTMLMQRAGLLGGMFGTLAATVSGLWISWALDLPSGICLTLAHSLCGLGSLILAPRDTIAS